MKKNTFCMLKVDREFATEIRDILKATEGIVYRRMNVMHDKAYKVLHVCGDIDAILDIAACNAHVVDIYSL